MVYYKCKRCGWKGNVYGGRPRCLACYRRYVKEWRQRNPDKVREQRRRWEKRFRTERPAEYKARRKRYEEQYYQRPEVKKRKREEQKKYRNDPRLRIRHLARWYTSHRIASGSISKEPCALCGKDQAEAHHLNYEKPLLIVWLCPDCHGKEHIKLKERS